MKPRKFKPKDRRIVKVPKDRAHLARTSKSLQDRQMKCYAETAQTADAPNVLTALAVCCIR